MAGGSRRKREGRKGQRLVIGAIVAWLLFAIGLQVFADDDWQVVTPARVTVPTKSPTKAAPSKNESQKADDGAPLIACGEPAKPADPRVAGIVSQITSLWGISNVAVYESLRPIFPHARPGGCIFYNGPAMGYLTRIWMNVDDQNRLIPLVYAVFAHEVGHEYHDDFSAERMALGSVKCELQADQFAGYTLSRLNMRAENVSDYYRLTGDDFGGLSNSHGRSGQRVEAFMQGWKRGQMGLTEQSSIGVGGEDHP